MEKPNLRPTVTITSYSTLKRIERQEHQKMDSATRSELSTEFFKINSNSYHKNGQQAVRSRVLIDLSQIKGPTGSVRGHKNVVRKSLEGIKMAYTRRLSMTSASPSLNVFNFSTLMASNESSTERKNNNNNNNNNGINSTSSSFSNNSSLSSFNRTGRSSLNNSLSQYIDSELYCSEFLERLIEDEQNLCVAYTTTLGVIRRTFEDSKIMKSILNLNLIKYEERDIYLNQEYRIQLKMRMETISVPALFVDGQHIGGVKELETMNENGDLPRMLSKFKMPTAAKGVCLCCGNAKFIACQSCHGSRKSTIHHFKFNSVALRCIRCDKNDGLIKCPVCCCESVKIDEKEPEAVEEKEAPSKISDKDVTSKTIDSQDSDLSPSPQDKASSQSEMIDGNNNSKSNDINMNIKGKSQPEKFLKHDIRNEVSMC